MNGMPVFDRDGEFRGYRGIDRDITGRKSAKLAIDESRRRAEESVAEVQARDQRIQALELAIGQLKEAQTERDAAVASIQEALKASQLDLAKAGEDLGRLSDALRAREEEAAQARAAVDAKQAELDAQRASLVLLQQNLMDKETEATAMRSELELARGKNNESSKTLTEISASYKMQALELIAARGSLSGVEESLNRKEGELVTLHQQMGRMETELRDAKQAFATKAAELVQVQDQIRQLNDALELRKGELAGGTSSYWPRRRRLPRRYPCRRGPRLIWPYAARKPSRTGRPRNRSNGRRTS
jgi:chromosome segregation ATPase